MGIKDLWEVIEPAERQYTLEELAGDREQRSNALRIAVDIAIWTFHARSSKGGRYPELRLMFYRFCRLAELGIRVVFVFDGPCRPSWKRDREINTQALDTEFRQALVTMMRLFGFHVWYAHGEAEAECALLSRLGYVDMVMTSDVDAFLFGAQRVIRAWPARRNAPVPCYDIAWISQAVGLDRSDMILMALLRGSDYSHGSAKVGITIAEALARCRKHKGLMRYVQQLEDYDTDELDGLADDLRDTLNYELKTGCQGNLQKVYSSSTIGDDFPDLRLLRDFVNPQTKIQKQKAQDLAAWMKKPLSPDWKELAVFCREAFYWSSPYIIRRFSNLLFPGYLTCCLRGSTRSIPVRPSLQQGHINSFFRVTKGGDRVEKGKDIVVQVTNEKMVGTLRLYYVEFHTSALTKFQDLLRIRLDQTSKQHQFSHIFESSRNLCLDSDDSDDEDIPNEKDPQKLCRKWISAYLVESTYADVVHAYKSRKAQKEAKNRTKKRKHDSGPDEGQRLLTDFMRFTKIPNTR
ncbi:PIN domain-like protein [Fennellomyces sp. T-0311]|nr:PIN domain-like protein [Fennellomyces sp. T-0311]